MMIPQLSKALSSGYTSRQIIDFLMKKFPDHKDRIQSALATGFTVDQVLSFLSGGKKALNEIPSSNEGTTEYEKTRSKDIQQRENINKGALGAGALAATSLAAPMAITALKRAIPSSLGNLLPNASIATTTQAPIGEQLQPQQPPVNQVLPNIPQPQPLAQPEGISNPSEYLEKKGVKIKVDALLGAGNSPEQVAAILGMKGGAGKVRGQIDPELLGAIDAYSKEAQPEPQKEEKQPLAKSAIVASPHGAGEIITSRNGKSIVEVDGKKHAVNDDDLIQSPIPKKELADLYDDLIAGIEKEGGQEVSRNVNWSGYDPNTNELAYRPHGGKLYVYDNISPEDVAELTSILSKRKSTGENYIGAWTEGSKSPIGAAMFRLIQKLQKERGGKGNEYKNRFETLYDALELATSAAKKKYAEEKRKAKKPRIG